MINENKEIKYPTFSKFMEEQKFTVNEKLWIETFTAFDPKIVVVQDTGYEKKWVGRFTLDEEGFKQACELSENILKSS